MSTEAAVLAAKNPQEAMLAIAQALDRIESALASQPADDGWGGWTDRTVNAVDPGAGFHAVITGDETYTEVQLPPVTEERKDARRKFELQYLKLNEHIPDEDEMPLSEAYAIGGPRWLYYGNRELFMSYPDQIKQAMINDIIEDSPDEAQEIGRDALKVWQSGPGNGMQIDESVAPAGNGE